VILTLIRALRAIYAERSVGSDSNVKNYPPSSLRLSGTGRRDDYRRRRRLRLFTKVGAFIRMRRLCHRERARLLQCGCRGEVIVSGPERRRANSRR
jgi:hypothetical protein